MKNLILLLILFAFHKDKDASHNFNKAFYLNLSWFSTGGV